MVAIVYSHQAKEPEIHCGQVTGSSWDACTDAHTFSQIVKPGGKLESPKYNVQKSPKNS